MRVEVNYKAILLVAAAMATIWVMAASGSGAFSLAVVATAWGLVAVAELVWPFFASRERHRSPR